MAREPVLLIQTDTVCERGQHFQRDRAEDMDRGSSRAKERKDTG